MSQPKTGEALASEDWEAAYTDFFIYFRQSAESTEATLQQNSLQNQFDVDFPCGFPYGFLVRFAEEISAANLTSVGLTLGLGLSRVSPYVIIRPHLFSPMSIY